HSGKEFESAAQSPQRDGVRKPQQQHGSTVENERKSCQGELGADVPGQHGINLSQDSLDRLQVSAGCSRRDESIGHGASIPQNKNGEDRDNEKPNRALRDVCNGGGAALEHLSDG